MPDTDLHQSALRAVRAAAEIAELAQATTGLVTAAALRAGLGYPDAALSAGASRQDAAWQRRIDAQRAQQQSSQALA